MTASPTATPLRVRPFRVTRALFLACHPGPALAVTCLGGLLAVAAGRDAAGTAWVTGAVLAGQLSIGWSNDALDAARDTASGRTDKPAATGALSPRSLRWASFVALAACVPLSLATGLASGVVHLVAVASAWSYNLGLKGTVASFVPYAVSFGLLPAVATLGLPGQPWPPSWVTAAGALLGVAGHAANVAPDVDDDLSTGVRGLPQRLGRAGAYRLAATALVTATAVLVWGPNGQPSTAGTAVVAVAGALGVLVAVTAGRRGRASRAPFVAVIAVALTDVVLLLLTSPVA